MSDITVTFMSHHRKPQCAPNPAYPNGIDVDLARGAQSCLVDLPYPAECCGIWIVVCDKCGYRAGITTAGRIDDPRTAKLPCKPAGCDPCTWPECGCQYSPNAEG